MKTTKNNDTDFLYLSTRIRALENNLIGKDKLEKMIDAKSFDEALKIVTDNFSQTISDENDYEILLQRELERAYFEVEDMLSSPLDEPTRLLYPFRYSFDCHNLKSAIKCEALKISPEALLVSCGSVSAEDIITFVRERNFGSLPKNMGNTAPGAIECLYKTGDPQSVDILLDKACFADMKAEADFSGLEYVRELINFKTDIVNIMIFYRCASQKRDLNFMISVLLPGGNLGEKYFEECFDGGAEKLAAALFSTHYSALCDSLSQGKPARDIERLCENLYMDEVQKAKYISFGSSIAVGYVQAKEYEIKNVRIVLAGKKAGISPDILRERLRESF